MWAGLFIEVYTIKDDVGDRAGTVKGDGYKWSFRPRGLFGLSEVSDIPRKQMIFNFLGVILAGPFRNSLGVVWPLPFAGGYFEVGDSTHVGWFENMMEFLVRFAAVLAFDKAFHHFLFVGVAREGVGCGLFVQEHTTLVGGFGNDCVALSLGCLEEGCCF